MGVLCRSVLLTWLILAVNHNAFTQFHEVRFRHIGIEDGLSQSSVNTIYQDSRGFIWIGTQDGLNRFDGTDFTIYRTGLNDHAICGNYIYDILEREDAEMWVATFGGGLIRIDQRTQQIDCFSQSEGNLPSNRIFSIAEDDQQILWLGSNEGLIRFDPKEKTSEVLFHSRMNFIGSVEWIQDRLWIGGDSGLIVLDPVTQRSDENWIDLVGHTGTVSTIAASGDTVMLACQEGLFCINTRTGIKSEISFPDHLPKGVIQSVCRIHNGNWLIATGNGLFEWHPVRGIINTYYSNVSDPASLSNNNVIAVCQSEDQVVWVGTRNGLSVIENPEPAIRLVRSIPGESGLQSRQVNAFAAYNDTLVWAGTSNGLHLIDMEQELVTPWNSSSSNAYMSFPVEILSLYRDEEGVIWVGTKQDGVYRLTGSAVQPVLQKISVPGAERLSVHCIRKDPTGRLWLGTSAKGLWRVDPDGSAPVIYSYQEDGTGLSHTYVFCLEADTRDRMWIGTPTGGVNVLDTRSEKIWHIQNDPEEPGSLSNDIILSFYTDDRGYLWVGTVDGLNRTELPLTEITADLLDRGKVRFRKYGRNEGLPNEVVYGMLDDGAGSLWMSTNRGIAVFHMADEKVSAVITPADGLQNNEFNQNAFYLTSNGTMFFGGVEGMNFFEPGKVFSGKDALQVVLTNVALFNETVPVGGNGLYGLHLENDIGFMDELELSYKHDMVTFHYAALSFKRPEQTVYRYKLEGFDKKWVYADDGRSATYTNLKPGKYSFLVEAAGPDLNWSGTSIKVMVGTPPWLTWYATLFYLLLAAGLIYTYTRLRIRAETRKLLQQQEVANARIEERELYRKKSAADFHDEAGKFITKINLFAEMAGKEAAQEEKLSGFIQKIRENTLELGTNMRDFLWSMDVRMDNLYDLVDRMRDAGELMLTETGIMFRAEGLDPEFKNVPLSQEMRRVCLQLFKEAFLNTARHSGATKAVLKVTLSGQQLQVLYQDNGTGIVLNEAAKKGHYGLKLMQERAEKIGGSLQIESPEKGGTLVTLDVKIPQMGDTE